ncbi:MAG: hypothetical protein ABR589_06000, partial [Chthoniobacterales bacterium]
SAALESYKADNGVYPSQPASTETLAPSADPEGGDPANFLTAGEYLYMQICGDSDGNPANGSDGRSYFTAKPNMLSQPPPSHIRDPFGKPYGYSTRQAKTGAGGYNPTFDLWSTAGERKSGESFAQYQQRWIKNW